MTVRIPNRLREPLVAICSQCGTEQGLAAGEFWPGFCSCGGALIEKQGQIETLYELVERAERRIQP